MKKKEVSPTVSRNWIVDIYTKFDCLDEFSIDFILDWCNVSSNEQVRFVLYKFLKDEKQDIGLCLRAYVELRENVRKTSLMKIFSIRDTIVKLSIKPGYSKDTIKQFIYDCNNPMEEIYWFGIPRFGRKTKTRSDFRFIIENGLTKKAVSDYSVPVRFKSVLFEEGIFKEDLTSLDDIMYKGL